MFPIPTLVVVVDSAGAFPRHFPLFKISLELLPTSWKKNRNTGMVSSPNPPTTMNRHFLPPVFWSTPRQVNFIFSASFLFEQTELILMCLVEIRKEKKRAFSKQIGLFRYVYAKILNSVPEHGTDSD